MSSCMSSTGRIETLALTDSSSDQNHRACRCKSHDRSHGIEERDNCFMLTKPLFVEGDAAVANCNGFV